MSEPDPTKRRLTWTVATPLMTLTLTTDLGLSIRVSMFEYVRLLTEASSLEWARAENSGADRWVLQRRGFLGVARVNKVTPMSLGYPLSVSNKNSTLKKRIFSGAGCTATSLSDMNRNVGIKWES